MTSNNTWYNYSDLDPHIWYIKFGKMADENQFQSFLVQYESRYINFNKKSIIFNALDIEHMTFSQCYHLANMMQRMRPVHMQKLSCFTIVISNPYIISLLNFVFSIVPPVRPYIVCKTVDMAKKFIYVKNPHVYHLNIV